VITRQRGVFVRKGCRYCGYEGTGGKESDMRRYVLSQMCKAIQSTQCFDIESKLRLRLCMKEILVAEALQSPERN